VQIENNECTMLMFRISFLYDALNALLLFALSGPGSTCSLPLRIILLHVSENNISDNILTVHLESLDERNVLRTSYG
jgi:hypothetical protein